MKAARWFFLIWGVSLFCFLCRSYAQETQSPKVKEVFFETKIRPLLAGKCWECHGPQTQESGLRLDQPAAMLRGGHSGRPAVVPGAPEKSRLFLVVSGRDPDDVTMPPEEPLARAEVELLRRWIHEGAYWPKKATPPATQQQSWEQRFEQALREHWALQPLRRPRLPKVKNRSWPRRPWDRYVLARLEQRGMSPSPPADRRTLIRRATLDLWGLPPTPEEVEAFLNDSRPDAYQRLIDRLLASPRYGERWARHWLDVARYADTRGYAFGQERRYPYAYTYRDWVIQALNRDVPYDRFVKLQLAADYLPDRASGDLAALGFLTVGRKYNNRHEDIDDQIDVVTRGLLGLTVMCARCHDHKYDPIPTEDYYSLYGVFANCFEPEELPLLGDPAQTPGYAEFKKEWDRRRAELEKFIDQKLRQEQETAYRRTGDYLAQLVSDKKDPLLDKQLAGFSLDPDDLRPRLIIRWGQYLSVHARPEDPIWGPWSQLARLSHQEWAAQAPKLLQQWQARPEGNEPGQLNPLVKKYVLAAPISHKLELAARYGKLFLEVYRKSQGEAKALPGVKEDDPAYRALHQVLFGPQSPVRIPRAELVRYLNRADSGRYRALKKKLKQWEVESPGAPPRAMVVKDRPVPVQARVFIRGNPRRLGKPVPRRLLGMVGGPRRKPFARGSGRLELAEAMLASPLAARVIVNRIWMHHFGRPLVATPSDFGVRTPRPVQHDVLDYLAWFQVKNGWSLKKLHREIMLSATYQQASTDRPECRRVDPNNQLLWRMNRRRLEWEALRDSLIYVTGRLDQRMGGRSVNILKQPFVLRRTVYAFIDRQDLPELFRVFDIANPDQSTGRRPETTVPQQALFLMNSPFVLQQAKALAAREDVKQLAAPQRLRRLFLLTLGREPRPEESRLCLEFIRQATAGKAGLGPWEQLAQVLLCSNEFAFIP